METDIPAIDYNAVLVDLRKKRDEIDKAICGIEIILGLTPSASPTSTPQAHSNHIAEDAFFGLSIAEAAKKFLNIKKKPQTTKQIAEALTAGGLQNASGNFGNSVGSVLNRNAATATSTFVNVSRGTWGLRSWYPNYRPKTAKGGSESKESGLEGQESNLNGDPPEETSKLGENLG